MTVEEAASGAEAVLMMGEAIKMRSPIYDAVFLDCLMPVMDGPSVAAAMRRARYTGKQAERHPK